MKKLIASLFLLLHLSVYAGAPKLLKTDYQINPLGIDNPAPWFSWEVGDQHRGAVQSAYRVLVSSSPEKLNEDEGDVWDSNKMKGNQTLQIIYSGRPLKPMTRYYWKVQTWNEGDVASGYSPAAWFETGMYHKDDWKAQWIGDGKTPPSQEEDFYGKIPSPLFRKTFHISKKVQSARLYVSGLGYYEAYLNGEKTGDHYLDPGWTRYDKEVYYAVYDVTHQVKEGENALGAMIGNGWYNPLPMRLFGRFNLREILTIGQPKLLAQLEITYSDGSRQTIATDESWKTADGPIVKNNVYLGEWYDARLDKSGWKSAGYNDSGWESARLAPEPEGVLRWQYIPPIRQTKTVHPVTIHSPQPEVYVVDMGQNFAGVIRYKLTAPAGTEIRFRYSELLYDDGTPDFRTTAATQIKEGGINGGPGAPATAWQEDRYIAKGEGVEVFEPKFTFHGFRYVEITGLPSSPSLNDLEGIRLNADLQANASFRCSNELFNRVQEITEWTMLSNVFSVQSDCPAREKFGYGGDIVTAGETYLYNYDMSAFYQKTARDFANDALPNGAMTECAPDIGINSRGVVEGTGPVGWTLAHPFIVEQVYRYYGNLEFVKEQYQPMKDLVDFYRANVPGHIITTGIGDHVSIDERPTPVTSTAFYYHHARILSDMAKLLGNNADADTYEQLAGEIKNAFINEFVNEQSGKVYTHTQAAQVFALYYDLLPEEVTNRAIEVLKDEILIRHKGHLSTGIFSTKMMLNYLSDNGMDELNYMMMNQKDYPGYGYMIDKGATTLWENWPFKQNDSKNHPMFGSVSEWFHKSILGIQQSSESVAFSDIVIKPSMAGGLKWAKGHYQSVRGRIGIDWWKFGDDVFMNVEIPANTKALVHVPIREGTAPEVFESDVLLVKNGKSAEMQESVEFLRATRNTYVFAAGSGTYRFVVRN